MCGMKCTLNGSSCSSYQHFYTVYAINFLFSTLHTTHHFSTCMRKYLFGVLHKLCADITRSNTPWGSKPPHLQVGVFKSLPFWCLRRGTCRYLFVLFVTFYIICNGDTVQLCNGYTVQLCNGDTVQLCKVHAIFIFPTQFAPMI